MTEPGKRICPFCAETISAKAKLCPHCRQWLTLKSFHHPLVMLLAHTVPLLGVWVASAIAVSSIMDDFQNPRPYYSQFPDSLKVIDSQMNWAQTEKGLRIYVTGVLTNTSPMCWKNAEFDCRFFDAHGAMVDADTGHSFMTTLAHGDAAFRVSIIPAAPTNEYASFRVSVDNARNQKSLF